MQKLLKLKNRKARKSMKQSWFLSNKMMKALVRLTFFFSFLASLHSMQDLSSQTRDHKPVPPVVEARSLYHWTTREVPQSFIKRQITNCKNGTGTTLQSLQVSK